MLNLRGGKITRLVEHLEKISVARGQPHNRHGGMTWHHDHLLPGMNALRPRARSGAESFSGFYRALWSGLRTCAGRPEANLAEAGRQSGDRGRVGHAVRFAG